MGPAAMLLLVLQVTVGGAAAGAAGTGVGETDLGPRVTRLLDRAEPPPPGAVSVALLVSADTVVVGEQLDVVTAAWLPRELLGALQRPPSLRPPQLDGVYGAVEPGTARVVRSLQLGSQWYDLYATRQIVFPLREGTLQIPAAELAYTIPATRSFGEDQRVERRSPPDTVIVRRRPMPPPAAVGGAVARDLSLAYQLPAEPARAGEPIQVDLVLAGFGNLALWPAPIVQWPEGSRGYSGPQSDASLIRDGLVGGIKRFSHVLVPDSSGTLVLPELRYDYYDPARAEWRVTVARSVLLPVQPRPVTAESRGTEEGGRTPMPLLRSEPWSVTVISQPVLAVLVLLVLVPPLATIALRRRERRSRQRTAAATLGPVQQMERLIRATLPAAEDRRPGRMAARLREAGLDRTVSAQAAELYHRFSADRFDAGAETPQVEDAQAQAARVVAAWPRLQRSARSAGGAGRRGRRGRGSLTAALVLLGLHAGPSGAAQLGGGDSLYRAGAYAAAAEELLRAAAAAPSSARLWYNAGAAAWAAEQDARAAAAWLRARQLAPRNRTVARGWHELTRRYPSVRDAGPTIPVTPAELVLLAGVAWTATWVLLLRRQRPWALASGGLALLLVLGAGALERAYRRPLAFTARPVVLRDLPHGRAQEITRLEKLTTVTVRNRRLQWCLVERSDGAGGWVPAANLVEVRRLDFRS
jgi:tetratricopeptide (TPR) repeat protein